MTNLQRAHIVQMRTQQQKGPTIAFQAMLVYNLIGFA